MHLNALCKGAPLWEPITKTINANVTPTACTKATFKKTLLIMKFTAFLLLAFCLHAGAKSYAQITLKEQNVPLQKVFAVIKQQSGYDFLYPETIVEQAGKISITITNVSLETALEAVLKGKGLGYSIVDKTIIIRKKEEPLQIEQPVEQKVTIDVSGRVTDKDGKPLEGASVAVQAKKIGTTTNSNGVFVLKGLSEDDVLTISFTGFTDQQIKVGNKTSFLVKMEISDNPLDEIQVVAYGNSSKRKQTGNVSIVKASVIEKQPVSNPLLALQGRVPGLFITQSNGMPGGAVQVTLQGKNSIGRGSEPFYVIDGVPYTSTSLDNRGYIFGHNDNGISPSHGNPLNYINPSNIESITVLKDADATAIYGSRAANGAILITTKKGKAGKTKVDINVQEGWGKVAKKLELLNTAQYMEMRREAKRNDNAGFTPFDWDINGLWDTTSNTDWQKKLIGGTSHYTNVDVDFSGGSGTVQYLFGATYHKETLVFPGDFSDQKGSAHFNLNSSSVDQKFKLQVSFNYLIDDNKLPDIDLTRAAVSLAPNAPSIYNSDGTLNWKPDASGFSSFFDNPLAKLYNRYSNKTDNLISNAVLSYEIVPNLFLKSSFGYNNLEVNEITTIPLVGIAPVFRSSQRRTALFGNSKLSSWIIEPQVTYKKDLFRKGKLDFLIGSTIQENNAVGQQLNATGQISDEVLGDLRAATTVNVNSTTKATYKYNAVFSRVNLSWDDKYLINLSGRRDGSSRFGPKSQFHNFGAIGAAWIFSNENFIQKTIPFLSFGKLRGSFGTTGNDQIGDYKFLTLYTPQGLQVPYQGVSGLELYELSNPYLQWEQTKKLQVGLELGLLKDRITADVTYVHNRSSNQLLQYPLSIITGLPSITMNLPATIQNTAWEIALNFTILKRKDFTWTSDLNVTIPQNKLVSFPNIEITGYSNDLLVGKPFTLTKVYHFLGVDPATGLYLVADKNGKPTLTPDPNTDKTVLINTAPTLYGGFQNSLIFKRVEIDFMFQFVKRKGTNFDFGSPMPGYLLQNQPISVLERWQKPGDVTSIQRFGTTGTTSSSFGKVNGSESDAGYSNASFARLKNISVSWLLPEKWVKKIKSQGCRLYVHGQNLLTITNYSGLDPESSSSYTLPPLRVITTGIQISF